MRRRDLLRTCAAAPARACRRPPRLRPKPLSAHLGIHRPAPQSRLVHRFQVRHLHSLGRLLGAGLCPRQIQGRDHVRRVVLELAQQGRIPPPANSTTATTAPTSPTSISPRCSAPNSTIRTTGPTSSHAPAPNTSRSPPSTTKALPCGATSRPTRPGDVPGTPWISAPNATSRST